jgi:hypothetical protein
MEQTTEVEGELKGRFGVLRLHEPSQHFRASDAPMTIIVTGVGSSGTSMTANVMSALGVSMGDTKGKAVFEDQEFTDTLFNLEHQALPSLIERRNSLAKCWGFKFPSLQNHLFAPQLSLFRNPFLIVVMSDPVAVTARASMSDPDLQGSVEEALHNVSKQTADMIQFLQDAACPTLLLSYEDFLNNPETSLDAIIDFCQFNVSDTQKTHALLAVSPNNANYNRLFHSSCQGDFNGVTDNVVRGWCKSTDSDDPLTVELLVDGSVVARVLANVFRPDLKKAGIGDGSYSFEIELKALPISSDSILVVQTESGWQLPGSGRRLSALRNSRSDPA